MPQKFLCWSKSAHMKVSFRRVHFDETRHEMSDVRTVSQNERIKMHMTSRAGWCY